MACHWCRVLGHDDPVTAPGRGASQFTSAARRTLEREYATIELTDSIAMMGGHKSGLSAATKDAEGAGQERKSDVLTAPPYTR